MQPISSNRNDTSLNTSATISTQNQQREELSPPQFEQLYIRSNPHNTEEIQEPNVRQTRTYSRKRQRATQNDTAVTPEEKQLKLYEEMNDNIRSLADEVRKSNSNLKNIAQAIEKQTQCISQVMAFFANKFNH